MALDELPLDGSGTDALDGWSFLHAAAGFAMAAFGFGRVTAYVLIVIVEIVELIFSRAGSDFFIESRKNIAADIAIGVGFYEAGRIAFKRKKRRP